MVLDILMFRKEKGGNPDMLRESQRRRCKDPELVDKVIALDVEWREKLVKAETLKKEAGFCSKACGAQMKAKNVGEAVEVSEELRAKVTKLTMDDFGGMNGATLKKFSGELNEMAKQATTEAADIEAKRDEAVKLVGNIVHESVLMSADEDQNEVIREWGDLEKVKCEPWNHVDLMNLLGMETGSQATATAGNRSYFLTGDLVRLQLGLINYAMNFLVQKGSTPLYPPFFMNKSQMGNVAELAQFDEELYHVSGDGEEKYLIATSEQPLCAFHANKWFQESELKQPIKYAGYSTCFRKEAGSHGRDTLGIFRVHQFEKIEQFMVCQPNDGESWKLLEEMIGTSEEFYKSLGLPYKVIQIVGGALNLAAAKKYDLEAYFPASKTFRELVSVSNCTDFQSRAINTRYGTNTKGTGEHVKQYAHMLNGTLCAITRTMCCICENYQTEEGIVVPEVLRPYMGGLELLKFNGPKVKPEKTEKAEKKGKAEKK